MTAHELAQKLLSLPDVQVCITGLYSSSTMDFSEEDVCYKEGKAIWHGDTPTVYIHTDLNTG